MSTIEESLSGYRFKNPMYVNRVQNGVQYLPAAFAIFVIDRVICTSNGSFDIVYASAINCT
jgi:hypothetical protein